MSNSHHVRNLLAGSMLQASLNTRGTHGCHTHLVLLILARYTNAIRIDDIKIHLVKGLLRKA
jgi:hypothetical protein